MCEPRNEALGHGKERCVRDGLSLGNNWHLPLQMFSRAVPMIPGAAASTTIKTHIYQGSGRSRDIYDQMISVTAYFLFVGDAGGSGSGGPIDV